MGEPACDLLTAELALDRLEAELATELPAHIRVFAASAKPPPAPEALRRPRSLVVARQALAHPLLADRALALVRLIAPIAIDDDPRVVAALAHEPTWSAYDCLTAARDAVARDKFGLSFVELVHRLHGAPSLTGDAPWPDPIAGWNEPDGARVSIDDAWQAIASRFAIPAGVSIAPRDGVRARAFIVEPRREVIVVVPRELRTPADRFAALHELGHAVVAMRVGLVPRVVDEAVASHVARLLETDTPDLAGWHSSLAAAARSRRVALARALDAIERGTGTRATDAPPWALWHDPGAQATYVAAEELADRLVADFMRELVAAQAEIDRATRL